MQRFTIFCAPDGRWTVWDNRDDEPAVLSGKPLIGLPKLRAETLARLLQKIDEGKDEQRPTVGASHSDT